MPLRLRKAQAVKSAAPKTFDPQHAAPTEHKPAPFFPLAAYGSVTIVHACLLGFTALYLPRSSLTFFTSAHLPTETAVPGQEAPPDALYLLTSNPARTVAWQCAGALLLQPWWAAWMKSWTREASLQLKGDRDAAEVSKYKLERSGINSERVLVGARSPAHEHAVDVLLVHRLSGTHSSRPLQRPWRSTRPSCSSGRPSRGRRSAHSSLPTVYLNPCEVMLCTPSSLRCFSHYSQSGRLPTSWVYPRSDRAPEH